MGLNCPMSFTRRDFFKSSAFLGTAMFAGKSFALEAGERLEYRFPVLQGATSFSQTQINVMSAEEILITVPGATVKIEKVVKDYSEWIAWRVFVTDLLPGKDYELLISAANGDLLDTRTFSTLRPELSDVKVALASCMRDTKADFQAPMWKALADSQPDLLFLLGDNVYVDDTPHNEKIGPDEAKIWRRYVETRMTLDLYHLPRLIPTLATWDDHDFGLNNSYGNTPWKNPATYVFRTLYAQDAVMPEVSWGPGISTSFDAYGQRFYLMDNRSFRDLRYLGYDHWGKGQENWLFDSLSLETTPGWIFTGSQVCGGYRSGWSFEGTNGRAFRNTLERLKKIEAPVLFGSGDVHYSEVMKLEDTLLGYNSLEITSSSMHSNAREPEKGNPRRIASVGEFNFVLARVKVTPSSLDLSLVSYGAGSREYFGVENLHIGR